MNTKTARPPRLPSSARYQFERPIGAGSAGTVYRAYDRRTERHVAVKVLKCNLSEHPALHQRLAREFRAATDLDHPNIVRALDMENDGEVSFLVYELIDGGSLGDRLEKYGRLPEDVAMRAVTQVAQALQYAHDRQVVHRDVKPDNILVQPDGTAKLTDFGLAKDHSGADDPQLTRAAVGLGTPHFMAPEQFANASTADARCDVYSLAATLYNLLTGKLPFDAKSTLAILTRKEACKFTPARVLAPGLGERVDVAIRAALDPKPERRPASCLEFFKLLTGRRLTKDCVTTTPAPLPTRVSPGEDRRAAARFALRLGSCGGVDTNVHGADSLESWPLLVRDVSATGIGVLLARRFEVGTELFIDLAFGPGALQQVPVRVVRVQPDRAGHWVHGCLFERTLSAEQLAAVLKNA